MAIPKRFAPPNPASDALRQEIAKLPEAERRLAEANLPGGSTISLAIPGGSPVNPAPAPESTPVSGASHVQSAAELLNSLKQYCTASKCREDSSSKILLNKGMVVSAHDYTVITPKGLGYLVDFGLL